MEKIIVSQDQEGRRLDKFLANYFKHAPMGFLYKMLRKKNITLNGKKASGNELLQEGDVVSTFFSPETFSKMRGSSKAEYEKLRNLEPGALNILYENENMAVINKPAGILSQKAQADDISLNELFLAYLIHSHKMTLEDYETFHPSVANRLDFNTSGIVLAGKSLKGQQELSRMLKERDVIKIYHCIVQGKIQRETHVCGYLCKDEESNRVTISETPLQDGQKIETAYLPLKSFGSFTLLQVHLMTGRTHQIRAHLAFLKHPIVGDYKYGDLGLNRRLKALYGVNRQMLHAYSVTFPDKKTFVADYPHDFQIFLKLLTEGE